MAGTVVADTWENGDGTENYKCRAWVNFNGTGTVAIREAGNVSSVADNGTGDYTINFTTAMPDTNYAWVGSASSSASNIRLVAGNTALDFTTSHARVQVTNASSTTDADYVNIAVFR